MARKPDLSRFQPAIGRLRAIAAESGDHLLLGDGAPHPDAKLLDLCAEIAQQRKVGEATLRAQIDSHLSPWKSDERAELAALQEKCRLEHRTLGGLLRRAGSIPATTAAGIYAKALAVRASKSGAALLGVSLAEDLLDNPALRASLWGAEPEPAPEPADNVVQLAPRTGRGRHA
jgi:hypothetical protein